MSTNASTKFIFTMEFTSLLGNFVKGQADQGRLNDAQKNDGEAK
jgi:hypothetical protein